MNAEILSMPDPGQIPCAALAERIESGEQKCSEPEDLEAVTAANEIRAKWDVL